MLLFTCEICSCLSCCIHFVSLLPFSGEKTNLTELAINANIIKIPEFKPLIHMVESSEYKKKPLNSMASILQN